MKKAMVIKSVITELSTAWILSENCYKASVIESKKSFGRLARTIKIGNYFFDIDQMIKIRFNTADTNIKQ